MNVTSMVKRLLLRTLPATAYDHVVAFYWRWKNRSGSAYEPERELLSRFIPRGAWVVDVGVNYAQYTTYLARCVGPTGRVIGFEASRRTFGISRRIVRAPQVILYHRALSNRTGELHLHTPATAGGIPNAGLASILPPGSHAEEGVVEVTPAARLDDMVGNRTSRIAFIKCDVEGHEVAVMEGGMGVLRTDRPVLLVEVDAVTFAALDRILGHLGYEPRILRAAGELANVHASPPGRFNCFFLPADAPAGGSPGTTVFPCASE